MRIISLVILIIVICHKSIDGLFDTELNDRQCTKQCICKTRKNSSKVIVVSCSIEDVKTPLECNVEWPVLFIKVENQNFPRMLLIKCQFIKKLLISAPSKINVLKADMFAFTNKLEILVVKSQKLSIIDHSFMKNMPLLKRVDISETKITEISRSMFEECPVKNRLKLSLNQIEFIENSAFINCISLKILDLSNNKLVAVTHALFNGLLSLEELDLSSNLINTIEYLSFKNLPKIKVIDLSGNNLKKIDKDTFGDLKSLTHLKLKRNPLSYISLSALKELTSLSYLDLSNTKLNQLDMVLFKGLGSLHNLDLPKLECVEERSEDYLNISDKVRMEFGRFSLCSGLKRQVPTQIQQTIPLSIEKQKQIQPSSVQALDQAIKKPETPSHNILQFINDQPYLLPMLLGGLIMLLISVVVVAIVCHIKNKQITNLRFQELNQYPVMQSTL